MLPVQELISRFALTLLNNHSLKLTPGHKLKYSAQKRRSMPSIGSGSSFSKNHTAFGSKCITNCQISI